MTERSRFFDDVNGDRSYQAEDFAEYFRNLFSSGLLDSGDNLKVYLTGTDRTARVKCGIAWIEGYFYKSDAEVQLAIEVPHATYDRIDRVVLRLDRGTEARNIKAFIKTGVASASPVAPDLTRNNTVYEISLAKITVPKNTAVVAADKVTDERLNTSVCGLVDNKIVRYVGLEVSRDINGAIQYDSGTVTANNTEITADTQYSTAYKSTGKTVTVDCTNMNFIKVDYELSWNAAAYGGSATTSARLKNNANGLTYALASMSGSTQNLYAWVSGYADVSGLTGNQTFTLEVSSNVGSSEHIFISSRGLDVHKNSVRQVRWS